jgi:hypothetical protein
MKNNSKIASKQAKATPSGVKADQSFTKRSTATQKITPQGRSNKGVEDYGPATSSRAGQGKTMDGAGTRSMVGLPPETTAMRAPAADLPESARALATGALPVPSCDAAPVNAVWGWDAARDAKLGAVAGRAPDNGKSGSNQ